MLSKCLHYLQPNIISVQQLILFLFTFIIQTSADTNETTETTLLNDILQNATSLPNVPYETAYSTDATFGSYSSEYIAEVDIAVEQIPRDDWPTIERRLEGVLGAAFVQSTRAHLRQNIQGVLNFEPNSTVQNIKTKVLGTRLDGGLTKLSFVTTFDDQLVPSDVVAKDISLMTYSHISAALQLPVINIIGQHQIETNKIFRWWLVGVIVGSGLLLIVLGWCCLFCYYNTCGRPITVYQTKELPTFNEPYEIEPQKAPVPNIVVTESSPGTRRAIEQDHESDNHAESKNSSTTRLVVRKRQRHVLPRRHHNQHRSTAAPRRMPSPLTRSLVVHGSALQESKLPTDIEQGQSKPVDIHSQSSATLHNDAPPSSISADIETIHPEEPTDTRRWSPYMPGDFVAATYGIGPNMSHHPSPMQSTENGIIELAISPRTNERI